MPFPTLFRPETFVATLTQLVGSSGAWLWLQRIGMLLATILFLYNLYMALATQSGSWVTEALIRAAVVGAVLANADVVTNAIIALHQALSAIGEAVFEALSGPEIFQQVLDELRAAQQASSAAVANQPWWQLANALAILVSTWLPLLAFLLFVGAAIAIYQFLLFGSYLMLALAVVLLPISIAFFVSRSMQRFTYEWFQVVLHSALIVMLAKAAAGLIANHAVLAPIRDYARAVQEAAAGGAAAWVDFRLLLGTLIGLTIGIFSLLAVQGIASAFVGRVESVAGAIAAMYMTARMAPAAVGAAVGAAAGAVQVARAGARRLTTAAASAAPGEAVPMASEGLAVDRTLPGSPQDASDVTAGHTRPSTGTGGETTAMETIRITSREEARRYLDEQWQRFMGEHEAWLERVLRQERAEAGSSPLRQDAAPAAAPPAEEDESLLRAEAEEFERIRQEDVNRSRRNRPDAG